MSSRSRPSFSGDFFLLSLAVAHSEVEFFVGSPQHLEESVEAPVSLEDDVLDLLHGHVHVQEVLRDLVHLMSEVVTDLVPELELPLELFRHLIRLHFVGLFAPDLLLAVFVDDDDAIPLTSVLGCSGRVTGSTAPFRALACSAMALRISLTSLGKCSGAWSFRTYASTPARADSPRRDSFSIQGHNRTEADGGGDP